MIYSFKEQLDNLIEQLDKTKEELLLGLINQMEDFEIEDHTQSEFYKEVEKKYPDTYKQLMCVNELLEVIHKYQKWWKISHM